jgi:hypothetical protein
MSPVCPCGREHYARGLCNTCWKRAWRQGRLDEHPGVGHFDEPPLLADQLAARGWDLIEETGCWVLHGGLSEDGYGRLGGWKQGKHYRQKQAHRVAYECWVGPIPEGHRVIQKCGNPACINPDHLFTKSKQMFFQDMQAESMASRHIHQEAKPRKYRLSAAQVREVDGLLRTARLGRMEGRLTKGEYEHRMFEIERYVQYIRDGCCAPSVTAAVGAVVPAERRWEHNGFQPPQNLRGTLSKKSKHGGIGSARDRIMARQKARDAS